MTIYTLWRAFRSQERRRSRAHERAALCASARRSNHSVSPGLSCPPTAARFDAAHQDEPVPHTIHYAVGDNRVDITLDDGGTSSLWWATKNEWFGLLDVAGLQVEALHGGFAGEPFDEDSREYVFVARR
jgi:hypothetical protein